MLIFKDGMKHLLIVSMFIFKKMVVNFARFAGEGEACDFAVVQNPLKKEFGGLLHRHLVHWNKLVCDGSERVHGFYGLFVVVRHEVGGRGEQVGGTAGNLLLRCKIGKDTGRQLLELQFRKDLLQFRKVRMPELHIVPLVRNWDIQHNGSQAFRHPRLILIVNECLAELGIFHLVDMGVDVLDAAKLGNQLLGFHLADIRHAWDIVGTVAPKSQNVN